MMMATIMRLNNIHSNISKRKHTWPPWLLHFKLCQHGKNSKCNHLDETRDDDEDDNSSSGSGGHSTIMSIHHDRTDRVDPNDAPSSGQAENKHIHMVDIDRPPQASNTTATIHHHLPLISPLTTMDQSSLNYYSPLDHLGDGTVSQQYRWIHTWSSSSSSSLSTFYLILILILFTPVCLCIKVVSLNVPPHVRKGSDLELSCLFDLGNATLYSLKWFYRAHEWDREEQEFFRYTPRHKPYKQVFPLEGIHVDLSKSSGSVVYIRQANSKTSGKYKCEISVEETFQTVAAEKLMTVFNSSYSNNIFKRHHYLLLYFSSLFTLIFTAWIIS